MSEEYRSLLTDFHKTLVNLNLSDLNEFCNRICLSKGRVILTGVGPCAFVAQKVSRTLLSINVSSDFLHPVDALHGDLGTLNSSDTVVFLSTVGECNELKTLIPYVKAKMCSTVLLTSAENSTLATLCAQKVLIHGTGAAIVQPELRAMVECTFASRALCVLDMCTVNIMVLSELTKNGYAMNHPAGSIGKRLLLTVSDVCLGWKQLTLLNEQDTGLKALMAFASSSKGSGCLLVVDNMRRLLGTISDADFRRALVKKGEVSMEMKVSELMNFSKNFPRCCAPNDLAVSALNQMNKAPSVTYLPVIDEDRTVAGLVTVKSLEYHGI